jgi:hypothetical protein
MNKPLSNEEIEQAIGPCVVLYSDLEKYPTIQNLLPRNGDYVVILVREEELRTLGFALQKRVTSLCLFQFLWIQVGYTNEGGSFKRDN